MVTDQRLASRTLASTALLVPPVPGRLLMFEGDLLHGVVPPAAADGEAACGVVRTTLMVALWRRMAPVAGAEPRKREDGGDEDGGDEAGRVHERLTGSMRPPPPGCGLRWPDLLASANESDANESDARDSSASRAGFESDAANAGSAAANDVRSASASLRVAGLPRRLPLPRWVSPVWERVGAARKRPWDSAGTAMDIHAVDAAVPVAMASCFQGITSWRHATPTVATGAATAHAAGLACTQLA